MNQDDAEKNSGNERVETAPRSAVAQFTTSDTKTLEVLTIAVLNECACALSHVLRNAESLPVDMEEDISRALDNARKTLKRNGVSVREL